jgi:L-ornithine Nalpha-acyltransferase
MSAMDALKKGLPCGSLVIKIADTPEELEQALRLRYRVFNEELGEGLPESAATGMDRDKFDDFCDHLLILDSQKVIGTYRLLPGSRRPPEGFYSETEFDFSKLGFDPNKTIELGRACVDPHNRKRSTLMGLFWGLHRYAVAQDAQYFLGCGSLPLMSPDDAEATYQALVHQGRVDTQAMVEPLEANRFEGKADEGEAQIPPLITFYLEFGAKILGRPAYDAVFKCYDLMVFFDMHKLSSWGQELLERFDKRLSSQTTK